MQSSKQSIRSSITIQEILMQNADLNNLASPRKMTHTLKCAVLTKSELRDISNGKMFSMTVADFDTTSTIKVVCFDENLYDKFDTTRTYDIRNFRVKKSLGNYPELQITEETKIQTSLFQFSVERKWFTVGQINRKETQNIRFMNLKAQIIQVEDVVKVGKHPNLVDKREVQIGDDTGNIVLVLWRDKAVSFNFQQGQVLKLENMLTSQFRGVTQLNAGPETLFTVINEEITPVIANATPAKHSCTQTINTRIIGLKDFTCSMRCINCKALVQMQQETTKNPTEEVLLTCESCTTDFLPTKLTNDCKILLNENKQWYSCSSGVIQHLFEWSEAKLSPTKSEKLQLLRNNYTMRLDTQRRIVEHVVVNKNDHEDEDHEDEDQTQGAKKARQSDDMDTDELQKKNV